MNIHPIFVHFPIALLLVYSFFEVVRIKKWQRTTWITPIKAILVSIGVLFAFVSLSTGEAAEHLIGDVRLQSLVETHSFFATVTTYVFLLIGIGYISEYLLASSWQSKIPRQVLRILQWYSHSFMGKRTRVVAAIIGGVAVTITGALGGAIVYGPAADPFVWFVYKLFFSF